MKKLICAAMALMVTASMFVGCGCRNTATDSNGNVIDQTTKAPTIVTEPHVTTVPPETTVPQATTAPGIMDDMTDAAQDFMDGATETTANNERSTGRTKTPPVR